MTRDTDATGLIRSTDPTRINEIDYMQNPRGASCAEWGVYFALFDSAGKADARR